MMLSLKFFHFSIDGFGNDAFEKSKITSVNADKVELICK